MCIFWKSGDIFSTTWHSTTPDISKEMTSKHLLRHTRRSATDMADVDGVDIAFGLEIVEGQLISHRRVPLRIKLPRHLVHLCRTHGHLSVNAASLPSASHFQSPLVHQGVCKQDDWPHVLHLIYDETMA